MTKYFFILLIMPNICFAFDCLYEKETKTPAEKICCEKVKKLNTDFRVKTAAGWKRAIQRGDIKVDSGFIDCVDLYYARRNSNSIGGTL